MNYALILITALLVVIPASILGVFLMQRKMVMVGDAISHAVLPGIVIAYLISGQRDSYLLLIGAALAGVFTTLLIDFLHQRMRIQQDAAIGTTFTFLFALGVLLISFFAGNNVDLDQECVLYGDLETSFLDQRIWNGYLIGTGALFKLVPLLIAVLTTLFVAYRPLQIWAFNPEFGKQMGLKINRWQLLVMSLVSLHAVLSFDSVGAIMVVGMLIIPPATASLMTNKLKQLILFSILIGCFASILGFFAAIYVNVSIAPMIVLMASVLFGFAWLWYYVKNKVGKKQLLSD